MRRRLRSLTARRRLALGAVALVLVSAAATTVALAATRGHDDGPPYGAGCSLVAFVDGLAVNLGLGLDTHARMRDLDRFTERLQRRHLRQAAWQRAIDRHLRVTLPVRRVVVCADGRCKDVPLMEVAAFGAARLHLRRAGPVTVTVVIERRDRPLHVASGSARLARSEPNGAGCGYWYHGSAKVDGDAVRPWRS